MHHAVPMRSTCERLPVLPWRAEIEARPALLANRRRHVSRHHPGDSAEVPPLPDSLDRGRNWDWALGGGREQFAYGGHHSVARAITIRRGQSYEKPVLRPYAQRGPARLR